jgi:hypothetical protein
MPTGIPGSTPRCSITGCDELAEARGWCRLHYQRWQRHGDPLRTAPRITLPTLAELGVTYRQLDHWTTQGYLIAKEPSPGSGRRRTWTADQLEIAERMGRLSRIGLTLALAHRIATGNSDVGDGITITIQPRSDGLGTSERAS